MDWCTSFHKQPITGECFKIQRFMHISKEFIHYLGNNKNPSMLKNYFYATTATGVKILLSNLQFAYRCVCMHICVPDVRSITTVRSSITCCFSLTCSLRNSISCSSRVLLRSFKDVCLFSAGCADNFSFYKIKMKSVINKNVLKGLPITVRTSSHMM